MCFHLREACHACSYETGRVSLAKPCEHMANSLGSSALIESWELQAHLTTHGLAPCELDFGGALEFGSWLPVPAHHCTPTWPGRQPQPFSWSSVHDLLADAAIIFSPDRYNAHNWPYNKAWDAKDTDKLLAVASNLAVQAAWQTQPQEPEQLQSPCLQMDGYHGGPLGFEMGVAGQSAGPLTAGEVLVGYQPPCDGHADQPFAQGQLDLADQVAGAGLAGVADQGFATHQLTFVNQHAGTYQGNAIGQIGAADQIAAAGKVGAAGHAAAANQGAGSDQGAGPHRPAAADQATGIDQVSGAAHHDVAAGQDAATSQDTAAGPAAIANQHSASTDQESTPQPRVPRISWTAEEKARLEELCQQTNWTYNDMIKYEPLFHNRTRNALETMAYKLNKQRRSPQ